MIEEKARLLEGLDSAHEAIRTLLNEVEKNQEIYPGWTIKQILDHLTGWDEAVTASLRAYASGTEAAIAAFRGIDEYNARSVETRLELNYEQTRREWEQTRTELRAALIAIPDDRFAGLIMTPWGARGTIAQLLHIFIHHGHEHANEIHALMQAVNPPGTSQQP